jgi:pimeloyl-ACP methyl ester carboxylesterase
MPTLARHAIRVALTVALLISIGDTVLAQPAPASPIAEDQRLLPYAQPGQLIDIGGRRINLRCSGSGTPTVVLVSGLGSWSVVWYKTQAEIAKRTRVCSFDRASYGFSDPAPRPQTLPDVPADLHATLESARVPAPHVLVGHSLGGIEVRMFAQRWPQEVAGMVIVDSSPAGAVLIEAEVPGVDDALGLEGMIPRSLGCALVASREEPSSASFKACMFPLPSDTPAALRRAWPRFFTLDYFTTVASLLSSLATHRHDGADHLEFGDKPLVVLSMDVDVCCPGNLPQTKFWQNYKNRWYAQHAALARMSSRGVHRVVDGSGHSIMLDKPEAVIDAVEEVLRQFRAGAKR